MVKGSSTGVPDNHKGDPDSVLDSRLQTEPGWITAFIWGLNLWVEDLCVYLFVSLSLSLFVQLKTLKFSKRINFLDAHKR